MKRKRAAQIKVQCLEDPQFHFQNFLLGVSLIRHENEVVNFRSIHLFEFRSDEHASKANKLQIMSNDEGLNLSNNKELTN
jgi:hypothetical protein